MISPRHRYLNVISKTPIDFSLDPLSISLNELIAKGSTDLLDVVYSYELFEDLNQRAIIDAFILSKLSTHRIHEALEIPLSVLEVYRYLFMDTNVFRSKLDRLSYCMNYEGCEYGKDLIRTAISVGPDYLLWSFGDKETDIDTRQIVRRTMLDSFFRSMAHKGNTLTSGIAKEAKAWMAAAVKNAELLEKLDPRTAKAAHDELKIALEHEDDTRTFDNSPVPLSEILH